jgi:hypothetical protein
VHPDQTSAAQFGCAAREDGIELALVVVVTLCVMVVDAANIADDVAGLEDVGITGADKSAVGVLREEAEEVDGQSLVGVEMAIVSTNDRGVGHLDTFGVWLGGHVIANGTTVGESRCGSGGCSEGESGLLD